MKPSLKLLDYSILQQCMHCGMCLPACPTYDATKKERHSPRGRISLMRAVADDELKLTPAFADEMSYCLGCLACQTACPAGVDYSNLLETARAEVQSAGLNQTFTSRFWRMVTIRGLFMRPRLLRFVGRLLWLYQRLGLQTAFRKIGLTKLLPKDLRRLEPQCPTIASKFSPQLIRPIESPTKKQHRVALLTGCVQDLVFADINRDTADVLLANGCEVHTPPVQPCCGSLHAHNGEAEAAKTLAKRMIDLFPPSQFDAIITNAGGCGNHLRHYSALLAGDPVYAPLAKLWDTKLRDIHEWMMEHGCRAPQAGLGDLTVTYHDSCHLTHGQKVTRQPRDLLKLIPGLKLVELPEANWCCGSAGIYNITQPEQSEQLLVRKIGHVIGTGASVLATANPGCHLQIARGLRQAGSPISLLQPVTLLARAYRKEKMAESMTA
jgi:glycolate oxidase iron-sulfur subunit